MKSIVTKLRDLGETVPDGRIVDRLIHSLHKKYADLARGLRLQHPTLNDCENMMLLEERIISESSEEKENIGRSKHENRDSTYDNTRDPHRCRTCGRTGHIERDCRLVLCNGCGRIGHIERDCWIYHPDKRPNFARSNNRYTPYSDRPRPRDRDSRDHDYDRDRDRERRYLS